MSTLGDNSYLITGKVCPPKLPMQKIAPEGWTSLTSSLLESLFNEVSVQGRQTHNSSSLCALSFQASVWLSTDGLSASSVGGLPYFLCNFCDFHTDSKAKLLQHILCRHVFKCKLCDFVSFSLHELVQHQLHKHLDAEEMQPVLNSKMVLMNFSLLQRNLHIFSQCDSISNSSKCPDNKPAETEIANSSVINIPNTCPIGHHNNQSQLENGQLEPPYVKYESPVTSSKDKTHNVDVRTAESIPSFSKQHWNILNDSNKTQSISKRSYSLEEYTDCDLSPKRPRKSCNENSEATDDHFDQCQSHSSQMPHFLDDSDSYVTSSCSPHKNTSPVHLEGIGIKLDMREEQKSLGKNQRETVNAYSADQMLSFFMEPTSSAISRDLGKSNTRDNGNFASGFVGPLQKSSSLYDDFYCESVPKEAEQHLLRIHQTLSGGSRSDRSTLSAASKDADNQNEEEIQHPQLSMLSSDVLPVQPEKETSQKSHSPLIESCTDILETPRHKNNLLSTASHKTKLSVNNTVGLTDKNSRIRQSYSHNISSDVENFLILPENSAEIVDTKEDNSLAVDSRNDTIEHYGKHITDSDEAFESVRDKERYDLLRKLLLGTTNIKNPSNAVTIKSEMKQAELVIKDVSTSHLSQATEEDCGFQSHAPLVTRASDMSLRDLLTQGSEAIHQSLFFECSSCNFKTINKIESQNHIKVCKFRFVQNKSKTAVEILTKPDCEVSMAKIDSPSIKCESLDISEKFVASELLKGLSEHYSESLSSDVSLLGQSHELLNESQLYACDKSHTLQSENQVPMHDKSCASKSLVPVYYCDKSHTLKSGIETNLCDKSHTQESDLQINTCLSKDHVEGIGRNHVSNEVEANDSKHANKKSGISGSSNFTSAGKQDIINVKKKEENRLCVPLYKKNDLNIEEEFLCQDSNLLLERQKKSRYTCLYCYFSTNNVTYVRQHLFESHPTSASYVEALIPLKGKTLLYLCRGTQSTCTFASSESAKIFEHIKLCYCGHLDNFIHSDNKTPPDYYNVLFCLAQASEFINASTAMFFCLRCSYCSPEFQQAADHILDSHGDSVAGILSVNRSFIEPRIRMVCLVCKAHINMKHWVSHRCRKRYDSDVSRQAIAEFDSRDHCASKLETILRLSSLTRYQPLSYGHSSPIDSPSLTSGSAGTVFDGQKNCASQIMVNPQKHGSAELVNYPIHVSDSHCTLNKSFNENTFKEGVGIKQEILDITLEEVQNDDLPLHFKQEELETENHGTGYMPFSDIDSNSSSQKAIATNSPQTCNRKLTSGSSVLHSLLTATGNIELSHQGFSSLHKLLQSDLTAAEERRPSKAIPIQQEDLMSAAADLNSQYPCILEILRRQESALQETLHADSAPLPSTVDELQQNESREFVTRHPSSVLLNALCSPHVLSQQIHNATTTCLPQLHLLLPSEASGKDRGSLPSTSSAVAAESQDSTGPFTNLLQLLCQSKKSAP